MNAAEHFTAAEEHAAGAALAHNTVRNPTEYDAMRESARDRRDYLMERAQWHATMALAAATAELHPQGLTPGTFGRLP